jgi:sec-independent protein translocase protein TatC
MPLDQVKDKAEMSFLEHLEELRWHLVRSVSAIIILGIVAFSNKKILFDDIILAPKNPDFITYKLLCKLSEVIRVDDLLCIREIPFNLINITMSGQFTTHVLVSLIAGFVVAFPYVFWEIWRFIKPALMPQELKYTRGIVFFTSLLFILGVLFGYYAISPLSVNFLGTYSISDSIQNQISLTSFITTVSTITLASGLLFELPIIVFFFTKIGLLTPAFMKNYRKHAYVVILILSAIITPPDVSSQILVSIPVFLLYEISIYISKITMEKGN